MRSCFKNCEWTDWAKILIHNFIHVLNREYKTSSRRRKKKITTTNTVVVVLVVIAIVTTVFVKNGEVNPMHHEGKHKRKVEVQFNSFLTSALHEGEWSTACPGSFIPHRKSPRYLLHRELGGPQSQARF